MMTKEEEIKHLIALMGEKKGDTYFNQYFSTEDIEQMIQNIHDDFAIENDCSFAKKAEAFEKKLIEERKAADQEILDLVEDMLTEEAAGGVAINTATRKIGMDNTIKIKRKNKIALSEEEIDYLVSKLD